MAKKKEVYKVKPLNENKKNIIAALGQGLRRIYSHVRGTHSVLNELRISKDSSESRRSP